MTGGGTAASTRPPYVRAAGRRSRRQRFPSAGPRPAPEQPVLQVPRRGEAEHGDEPDEQHRRRAARATAPSPSRTPACRAGGQTPRRRSPRSAAPGRTAASRDCHERGDPRAAQHRPDLPRRVVDPGTGAGPVHRQVAGGRGGDRRPHEPAAHAHERDRQQQRPERGRRAHHGGQPQQGRRRSSRARRRRSTADAPGRSAGRRRARARSRSPPTARAAARTRSGVSPSTPWA